MSQYLRIANRLFNRPLLLLPSAAEVVASVLSSRTGVESLLNPADFSAAVERELAARSPTPEASRFTGRHVGPDGSSKPFFRLEDGVGMIPVVGELVNRGAWIGANSGLVSYEAIQAQLQAAKRDGDVTSVIIDLQTPGGEAVGAMETAEVVREVAAVKPVIAVVNGMAASAGYAIASGATEIVTTSTGVSGSIGVVMLHVDQSERLAKAGLKPTLIFAGAHKVDGHSFGPLPKGVAADMQAEVDAFYDLFVQTVAAGRPGLTDEQIRATEARTFIGQAAVDAGLADRVGTFATALADLKAGRSARTQPNRSKESSSMSDQTAPAAPPAPAPAATTTPAAPAAAAPAAAAPAATVDTVAVAAEATKAAQARIKAITTCEEAKGREPQANHLAFETTLSAEDAKAILAAGPKAADGLIAGMNARDPVELGSGGTTSATTETPMAADDIYAARREASQRK